jgi:hypothetical protein
VEEGGDSGDREAEVKMQEKERTELICHLLGTGTPFITSYGIRK